MMPAAVQTIPAQTSPTHADNLLGLMEIFEPECQIAVAARAFSPSIDAYLSNAAKKMGDGFRIVLEPGDELPLHLLPASPGCEAFANDIAYLAEVYGDLLGCLTIGLRLEVLHRAMCPRFHVDHTGIRLLCTYRGPGTEWLEDRAADRSKLGPASAGMDDNHSGIILDAAGIHRVEPYSVALLKGSAWQGNTGRGIIHRSPAVSADTSPRVMLALDALW